MPEIHLLSGERNREYVLDYSDETLYLVFAPEPLRSIALLAIDTGLRMGEALALEWRDVHLTAHGSQWGYVFVREGKSKNARRAVPLTRRAHEMPEQRVASAPTVFADESGNPYNVSYLDHLHAKTRKALKLPKEYVLHSLRDTYLTRLGPRGGRCVRDNEACRTQQREREPAVRPSDSAGDGGRGISAGHDEYSFAKIESGR